MKLLPSEHTAVQRAALLSFLEQGTLELHEPCDCGSRIRHNNGGNYHNIVKFSLDSAKCWRSQTFTGDYGPPDDWVEVAFSAAIDEIAALAAKDYYFQ